MRLTFDWKVSLIFFVSANLINFSNAQQIEFNTCERLTRQINHVTPVQYSLTDQS